MAQEEHLNLTTTKVTYNGVLRYSSPAKELPVARTVKALPGLEQSLRQI